MIYTYDPSQVLGSLGDHSVRGYSDGTFVNIEFEGDGITSKTGADGEVVRSIDPNRTATLTITVQQTSPTVAFCQQKYDLDRATSGGGMFPVVYKDLKSGMLFSAEHAWVQKPPAREYGRQDTDRTIVISTGPCTFTGEVYPES